VLLFARSYYEKKMKDRRYEIINNEDIEGDNDDINES
jgi:hypothetical protein